MGMIAGALAVGFLSVITGGGGWYYYSNSEPSLEDEYDFIIVGAGSAGSVLANRLSYDQNNTVLLLEAGGSPPFDSWVPAGSSKMQHTRHDWEYVTTPQQNALKGFRSRMAHWPRGKMMGGTSALNYMLYVRGHREDYNDWAKKQGCRGWGYDDVRKYFYQSEKVVSKGWHNSRYHNTEGELSVSMLHPSNSLPEAFVQACDEAGYGVVQDYNGQSMLGCSIAQVNIERDYRVSTYDAFLGSIGSRANLHVIGNALVSEIDIINKRADGVIVTKNNMRLLIKARKEVIISGGTVNSPQLLMVSGIGPKKHLEELKIKVLADLPVGQNLQDHMLLPLAFSTDVPTLSERDDTYLNQIRYFTGYNTPIRSNIVEALGFIDTENTTPGTSSRPDIMIQFAVTSGQQDDHKNFNMDPEKFGSLPGISRSDAEPQHYVYVLPTLLKPKSRGQIRLTSKDIKVKPEINPNYLAQMDDIHTLARGVEATLNIMKQEAWQSVGGDLKIQLNTKQCDDFEFKSQGYWQCIIEHFATTDYHPVGTCKMGSKSDKTAVVTPDLKVKGIRKLRVIDASIMPEIPAANTHAPTVMIAEYGAEKIMNEHKMQKPVFK